MSFYATKSYQTRSELLDILNGPPVDGARGTLGTNGAGSPNFGVPAAAGDEGDFTDCVVGDRILIEGESISTTFLIQNKTDNQNVVLDNNIVAAHVSNAVWRVLRYADRIPVADIQFGGPLQDCQQPGAGTIVYDRA